MNNATIPPMPIKPCYCCRGIEYWLRRVYGRPTWVCSQCHPFFTGKDKLIDVAGRVEKFQAKVVKSKELKSSKTQTKKQKNQARKKKTREKKSKK